MQWIFRYKKMWGCFLIIILFFTSCKKWVDVNYNPQQLNESSATPDLVLGDVLVSQGARAVGSEDNFLYSWMGYYAYPFPQAGDVTPTYNLTPSRGSGGGQQAGTIRLLHFIDHKAMELGQTLYAGIAKIIKAKVFADDVDSYNNIPYRESGDPQNYPYPKYDDGAFIYEDLLRVVDTGMNLIKEAAVEKNTRIEFSDVMFHGNKNKWAKFANTLKLRLLVHQANRSERTAYIQTEIAKIVAEGSGFLGTGEDAATNPGYTTEKPNSFVTLFGFYPGGYEAFARDNLCANIIAMNFLKENHDPRLPFFYTLPVLPLPADAPEPFEQESPAEYRGNIFGAQIDQLAYPYQGGPYVSHLGGMTDYTPVTATSSGVMKGYDMDDWMMTSVESLFLQAEAVQRGWVAGDAKQAYIDAVKESFRWLNTGKDKNNLSLSDAMFTNWYHAEDSAANPNVSWESAPDKYKLLMFQKYLALNGIDAKEVWTDYRRNGAYPAIPLSAHPDRTATVLPIRLPYPENEYKVNSTNVNAQGEINIFTSKIWWMP
ncbi:MAG: SusD/RagB family nutrient-binding outer membrane lipoprotein [Agriterribacter sp.]